MKVEILRFCLRYIFHKQKRGLQDLLSKTQNLAQTPKAGYFAKNTTYLICVTHPRISFAGEMLKGLPSELKRVEDNIISEPAGLESLNNRKFKTVQCIREFSISD